MQNFSDTPKEISPQELARMAGSPAGQQLLRMLQQQGGDSLRQAMTQAAAGDYDRAKQAIRALADDPNIKKLLEQMGG